MCVCLLFQLFLCIEDIGTQTSLGSFSDMAFSFPPLFWTEENSKRKLTKMLIMMVTQLEEFLSVFWLDLPRLMKDFIEGMSQICLILNNLRLGINWEKNHKHPLKSFY